MNGHCGIVSCRSVYWLGPASVGRKAIVGAAATLLPMKFLDTTSTSPLMSMPKWSSRALISSICSTCVLLISVRYRSSLLTFVCLLHYIRTGFPCLYTVYIEVSLHHTWTSYGSAGPQRLSSRTVCDTSHKRESRAAQIA